MLELDLDRMRSAARRYVGDDVPMPAGAQAELIGKVPDEQRVAERGPREPMPGFEATVRNIVAQAELRAAGGTQADTLRSLSDERIIGRGDLHDLNYLEVGIAVARGVARIRVAGGTGTGCLVGPRILLTNHHVIENEAVAATALAQFDVQEDSRGKPLPRHDYAVRPDLFFMTIPELDATLVGLAERSELGRPLAMYPWTQLLRADEELENADAITIIQHPLGGTKQIAFRNNQVILVPADRKQFIHYTTDTQPGSSGSPCFDDLWRLVALHHSGVPQLDANKNILTRDGKIFVKGRDRPDTIKWVANEGARLSAIADAVRTRKPSRPEQTPLRDALFTETPRNAVELARAASAPGHSSQPEEGPRMSGKMVSVVVNIAGDEIRSVVVERGAGTSPGPSASTPAPPDADTVVTAVRPSSDLDETTKLDPAWRDRPGYDPDFLGTQVPLPELSKEQQAQSVAVPAQYRKDGDDKYVYRYHHYSLAFNKRRRTAWYSAANIDGDRREHTYDRGTDKWSYDPRLDERDNPVNQMGEELYAAAKTDRGHLTRYLDVQWGDTLKETRNATNDTFVFANCALQLSVFNRGKDRWQGIERYLLEQKARDEKRRMVVFTGPVLRRTDPIYQNQHMDYRIRIPLSFWKLCAIVPRDGRELSVTAFELGQPDIEKLPGFEEKFDVEATQITVARLAKLTKLDFGRLTQFDHYATNKDGSLESDNTGVLTRLEDIVV